MLRPISHIPPDLSHVPEEAWNHARKRFAAIQPLLAETPVSKEVAKELAQTSGVHVSTLYRWLEAYRATGQLTALLPEKSGVRQGHTRLAESVERIVATVIEQVYLTRQRPSMQKVVTDILARCRAGGIEAPHPNTIRRRIARIPERVETKRRDGNGAVRAYTPIEGSFPIPEAALGAVQIDHTKVAIILVDDISRQPIGRPWITVAIDLFSRMIAGFYVSFDPPGAMFHGVVHCTCHAAQEHLVGEIRNYNALADLRAHSDAAPR